MNYRSLLLLAIFAAGLAQHLPAQTSTVTYFRHNNQDTVARAINNEGVIAGYYTPTGTTQPRGFLRAAAGTIESILAPGATDTRLHGINDLGETVGSRDNNTKAILRRANGEFVEITVPNATSATANAINNNGYVVGGFQNASTSSRAFLRNLVGGIVLLGDIIPGSVEAVAIANTTDRVVLSELQAPISFRIHINTPSGTFQPRYFYLPGQSGFGRHQAQSINTHNVLAGEIEGQGFIARPTNETTVLSTDGVLFALPGAASTHPYGINDNNQIVGAIRDIDGALTAFQIDPCSPNLATTSQTHGSGAEVGSFPLTTDGTGFCLWIASTSAPWVSFTRSIGSGPGSVAYQLEANTTSAERQAIIRVGTREFTITQASGDCHYAVIPRITQFVLAEGASVTYTISTTPGCPWTAASSSDWAVFETTFGTGNGTATVHVAPIPATATTQRNTSINVAGWSTFIAQQPPSCNLQLSRTTIDVASEGALENVRVNVRQGCAWTASINVPWITRLTNSGIQPSISTLSLTIAPNNGPTQRTGTIAIETSGPSGPLTNIITIRQAPAAACTYSLSPNYYAVPAHPEPNYSFQVVTGASCPIHATSAVPWIHILGTSAGTVAYGFDRNPSRLPRRGTIRVNGLTFTVDQSGNLRTQLGFVPVPPCRFMDTRNDTTTGGPALQPGTPRGRYLAGSCGTPASARALALRVTAIPLGPLAFLSVSNGSTAFDFTRSSTLNSWDGRTVSNLAIVPGASATFYASDSTHVVADIIGYFADPAWDSLVLYSVAPCRLLDTRTSGNTPIPAASTRTVQVAGNCGIPAHAAALSLNITAIPRNTTLESLTVYPTGQNRPNASPLNAAPGRIVANAALLATGTGGSISIHASQEADVLVDVNGYFSTPSDAGLYFNALEPCRIADTRVANGGQLQPGTTRTINPAASAPQCNVPAEARAHLVNATVVPTGPLAFLSLFPSPTWTGSSTLNAYDGQVTANLAIIPDNGQGIGAMASNATHLVLDTSGYFVSVPSDQRRPGPLPQTANVESQSNTGVNQ